MATPIAPHLLKRNAILVSACVSLLLSACGGGSGGVASDDSGHTTQALSATRSAAKIRNITASRVAAHTAGSIADDVGLGAGQTQTATSHELAQIKNAKMVLAYYSDYANNYAALTKYYANFNAVSVDFWNITDKGVIVGNGSPTPSNALAFLKSKNIPVYGCISNVDSDWSAAIAHSVTSTYRAASVANLVAFAKKNGMAGINIDFEGVSKNDRANLSNFTAALATALHANGMKLIISVLAFSASEEKQADNYAFDFAALGKSVDFIQVMTYDETIPDWSPGAVAGSDWMENALDYAVSKAPATKILNGIPAYGYDWTAPGSGTQIYWNATQALLNQYGVVPTYDAGTNAITFNYTAKDGSGDHTVWTENTRSVSLKASLVNAYGLGGTSLYALGMEDASFWAAVTAGLKQ